MDNVQKKKNPESLMEQESKFITSIPSVVRKVEWHLKDFKRWAIDKKTVESLRLGFEVHNTFGIPPKWSLYFKMDTGADAETIDIYLALDQSQKLPKHMHKLLVKYELLINCNKGGKNKHWGPHEEDFKQYAVCAGEVISHAALLASPSKYLPDGTLTVKLNMEIFGTKPINTDFTDKKKPETLRLQSSSQFALHDKISHLLESGLNSDIVISTKDDLKVFKAHRCILAARSPVFSAMFEVKMVENETGRVEISDISSKAVEILLKYFYSGTLEGSWTEVAEEIVYAAEKYDLPVLKEFCDCGLIDAVTPESAMNLLLAAKKYGLSTATADISLFVKDNVGSIVESLIDERSFSQGPVAEKMPKQKGWKIKKAIGQWLK